MAAEAALEAVVLCSKKQLTNRMKVTAMFPEMNPSMDSYRIGTLLELARAMAIKLAEQNLRVRVCVQGSMGVGIFTAIPKQLNGVSTLLQRMDWGSEAGGDNEGMVGDYVNFGGVGKEHVVDFKKGLSQTEPRGTPRESTPPLRAPSAPLSEDRGPGVAKARGAPPTKERERPPRQSRRGTPRRIKQEPSASQVEDRAKQGAKSGGGTLIKDGDRSDADTPDTLQDDAFILICPQNMLGIESSIIGPLSEMVDAAGDRPVIIINPDLTDKVSAQGQQSVRGRQQRLDFANSFETIYQFQNIYTSGTSYFPILGSVVKLGPSELWVAHQRRDLMNDKGEVYLPIYASETMPENEILMETFSQ